MLAGALFYSYMSQDVPVTHPDPWGLRVTPPFIFLTRLFLGRGTFGTFSPLASAVPGMTLLQWDIIEHCAELIERKRSNVASVREILSDNLQCFVFS